MRASAAERLTQALATLTSQTKSRSASGRPTIAELCRLAGVSRNSLYRYHGSVLKCIRRHQLKWHNSRAPLVGDNPAQLRAEIVLLRAQIAKLTALIDHYYAAYREGSTLLARRDRELAELRRAVNAKPLRLAPKKSVRQR